MDGSADRVAWMLALVCAATICACAQQSSVPCDPAACEVFCQIQGLAAGECRADGTCACSGTGADADADGDAVADVPTDGGEDEASAADAADVPAEADAPADADDGLAGTPGHIGGACGSDGDCVDPGATCLRDIAGLLDFPNGYCTIIGCVLSDPAACPAGSACQCGTGCMCLKTCLSNDDCRSSEGYVCTSMRCLPLPI